MSLYGELLDRFKRELVRHALLAHDGRRTRTAAALGIPRSHMARLIKNLKVDVPPVDGGERTGKREVGYTYEVHLSAIVEVTASPSTPVPELRAVLLANVMDLLHAAVPETISEVDDEAKAAGHFVDRWELLERRDLMTGKLIKRRAA